MQRQCLYMYSKSLGFYSDKSLQVKHSSMRELKIICSQQSWLRIKTSLKQGAGSTKVRFPAVCLRQVMLKRVRHPLHRSSFVLASMYTSNLTLIDLRSIPAKGQWTGHGYGSPPPLPSCTSVLQYFAYDNGSHKSSVGFTTLCSPTSLVCIIYYYDIVFRYSIMGRPARL